ncbi:hypothetical protein ACLF3G_26420 [Falsiroseomonas sp. HC035]|uniref:hypothetical protein n=1 Tax=Falsiroseomonas sp. HC035 TaxID=3390999 RepID=UPI003D32464A
MAQDFGRSFFCGLGQGAHLVRNDGEIFAAPLDKTVCYLATPLDGARPPAIGKIACVTEELGSVAFRKVEGSLGGLHAGAIRRANPEAVTEAEVRLAGMVADVLEALG